MIRLIILDWDDVITLGSKEGYLACYRATLGQLGVRLEPEEELRRIRSKWGQSHRIELAELLKENPEMVDEACSIYESHLFGTTFSRQLTVLPGAVDFLHSLSRDYILTVASGSHPKVLKGQLIPDLGLEDVFSEVVTAYDLPDPELMKPDPYVANKFLSDFGVDPAEALLVGDAENDVLMAQGAGIEPVVVLTGHLAREQAEHLQVQWIIDDVLQLKDVLSRISDRTLR